MSNNITDVGYITKLTNDKDTRLFIKDIFGNPYKLSTNELNKQIDNLIEIQKV